MASSFLVVLAGLAAIIYVALWYVQQNDRKLCAVPPAVANVASHHWSDEEIKAEYARIQANPIDIRSVLPPRTGRKYIVIGGAGFLGGWLVVHLLQRGEHPRRIRVLDIRSPTRQDLTTGAARLVDFRICDISDEDAVHAAFSAPWPESNENDGSEDPDEITVFHTAATIRFYERVWSLVPFSAAVNVRGTQHIIDAARSIGASVLISTSSGSISLQRSRFWLWPWEEAPPYFVQIIDDDDKLIPKHHENFFSNYAYTKRLGEALVRGADKLPSKRGKILRTGSIRPGNGVYGPGGDILLGATLVREINPSWIGTIVQNFVYVENASLAHLCYEQRLLTPPKHLSDDIGGQAFCVADEGPPPSYGNVYHALSILSHGRVTYPTLSPTLMLFISHIIEFMYLSRQFLLSLSTLPTPLHLLSYLTYLVPRLPAEALNLQPSLFALVMVHMIFSDTRARSPSMLNYKPQWTTLQGVCTLVDSFDCKVRIHFGKPAAIVFLSLITKQLIKKQKAVFNLLPD
ncbi:NAD-binding protein [Fomitiporia mediterranea MF3/22]|uniref:NAD-binding protein n=1 Tax=Fomitiporia mediterranea (strain MF3/22) TaxID=694068 RepID=UPI000440787C|nr:NAD-binding protein [Fomitiporia mediterranea MF3/22]EJD05372.1 NAD-binding protein [Fomitiporia mediterranea MF3/22]